MARIRDLVGNYYGTIVDLEDGNEINILTIWEKDTTPSEREKVGGRTPEEGYDHIESQKDYDIAEIVCEALTKAGY